MANYLLVRHKVADYSTWKSGYDEHAPKRVEAGLTDRQVLRGADDPNEVTILFEARDLDRARKFAASDDLKKTMKKAGVQGQPDIYFLKG